VQQTLTGIPASPGIVVGPVHLLRWEVPEVPLRVVPEDAMDAEMEKFRDAVERARERLRSVRERAEKKAGPEEAAIFDVQLSMLDDQELINAVEALIRKNHAA
jgi:phosphoenolpyruvate-protein phosphotransferase (PTS system enzyme I)